MSELTCPYCGQRCYVPEYVLTAMIRCPECSKVYGGCATTPTTFEQLLQALEPVAQARPTPPEPPREAPAAPLATRKRGRRVTSPRS